MWQSMGNWEILKEGQKNLEEALVVESEELQELLDESFAMSQLKLAMELEKVREEKGTRTASRKS